MADDAQLTPELTAEQKLDVIDHHDGFATLRNALHALGKERGLWAGMPMPMKDARLRIEPTWPDADKYRLLDEQINPHKPVPEKYENADIKYRNTFWSWTKRVDIHIYEVNGKIVWGHTGTPHHVDKLITTMMCSDAWGIEQEYKALQLLGTMIKHHMFKAYLLTGMFLESSPRSGVTYMFRKLRPTLAIKEDRDGHMRILAALCLHPIAYYEDSWAGAMTATDDIIAHLGLMRGDEHMFWKRANQHPAWRPEAGV